jgi:hypothetical protein
MLRRIHLAAAILAGLAILAFWLTTVATELSGDTGAIASAKAAILWGMVVLVPAIVATGATGFRLGGKRKNPLVVAKKRRMPLIAANGLVILLPSAWFLAGRAGAGNFDRWFYAVQAIELVAGAANLTLVGLNMRDGFRVAGRARPSSSAAAQSACANSSSKE